MTLTVKLTREPTEKEADAIEELFRDNHPFLYATVLGDNTVQDHFLSLEMESNYS